MRTSFTNSRRLDNPKRHPKNHSQERPQSSDSALQLRAPNTAPIKNQRCDKQNNEPLSQSVKPPHFLPCCEVDINKQSEPPWRGEWRDFRIALATVELNPPALRSLGPQWQDYEPIVAMALDMNGNNIRYASERLRADEGLGFLAAMRDPSGHFFEHLLSPARDSKDVVLVAVKAMGHLIEKVHPKHLQDPDVVFTASLTYPALPLAHPTLLDDKQLAANIARHCRATQIGENLQHLVHDVTFLKGIIAYTAREGIFVCRVWAMSGQCALTSFPFPTKEVLHVRRHCLALHRLFQHVPTKVGTSCGDVNATEEEWTQWATRMSTTCPHGLALEALNEIFVLVA